MAVSDEDGVMGSEECSACWVDRREDRAAQLVAVEHWELAQHDRSLVADYLDPELLRLHQLIDANVREVVDLGCSIPNEVIPAFFVVSKFEDDACFWELMPEPF